MSNTWIVNSSPVIVLAKAGQLHLLGQLAENVFLPTAVAEEILAGPTSDPGRIAIVAGWGQRESPKIHETVLEWGLGCGESAVLALALEKTGSTAILDDASARTAARTLGIPVIGSVGVIIRAKLRGLIPSARTVIADLRHAGLFLDEQIVRSALQQVGE